VHVAIDDHSRLAYAEVCEDESAPTTVAFTRRAIDFFAAAGVDVRRILTDNGSAYRSGVFAELLSKRGISMRGTRPYGPQTNGKPSGVGSRVWQWGEGSGDPGDPS